MTTTRFHSTKFHQGSNNSFVPTKECEDETDDEWRRSTQDSGQQLCYSLITSVGPHDAGRWRCSYPPPDGAAMSSRLQQLRPVENYTDSIDLVVKSKDSYRRPVVTFIHYCYF
jgi:hypothetical protein